MTNLFFVYSIIFFLGASVASAICVFQDGAKSFFLLNTRSACKSCKTQLKFYHLIPVVSFIFLQGKCFFCKTKIPLSLFVGEILLGLWFLFSSVYFGSLGFLHIVFALIFGGIFLALVLEDLADMQVSSKFVYALMILGLLKSLFLGFEMVALLVILPFWLIYFINKNAIGEADPYVYTALSLFFGTQFSISIFLYSVWFGAIYGICYLLIIKKEFERNVRMPFLPIIFVASLFILITNYHIIKIQDILSLNEIFSLYTY